MLGHFAFVDAAVQFAFDLAVEIVIRVIEGGIVADILGMQPFVIVGCVLDVGGIEVSRIDLSRIDVGYVRILRLVTRSRAW